MTFESDINIIINNYYNQFKKVPYLNDLLNHNIFWPLLKTLNKGDHDKIKELIKAFIINKIENDTKTKWWKLFKQFFESNTELFWEFRDCNENYENNIEKFNFVWKKIEEKMFHYDRVLTWQMWKHSYWLWKVTESFYDIIYSYFPHYNIIE